MAIDVARLSDSLRPKQLDELLGHAVRVHATISRFPLGDMEEGDDLRGWVRHEIADGQIMGIVGWRRIYDYQFGPPPFYNQERVNYRNALLLVRHPRRAHVYAMPSDCEPVCLHLKEADDA